jgi:hypothetical protein
MNPVCAPKNSDSHDEWTADIVPVEDLVVVASNTAKSPVISPATPRPGSGSIQRRARVSFSHKVVAALMCSYKSVRSNAPA